MSVHQHDQNANELWMYFQSVINWVSLTFTNDRKEMKGVDWGRLFNIYKDTRVDTAQLEQEVQALMMDEDVTNKRGIYPFTLTREEKYLNIRAFTDNQKREAYERQNGICVMCNEEFNFSDMEADHITPWSEGGKSISENCQMLCVECNRRKSNR